MTPLTQKKPASPSEANQRASVPSFALLPPGTFVNATTLMTVLAISESKLYSDVRERLLPPPVRIGKRMSRFMADEVNLMAKAIVCGASDDERAALVKRMIALRSQL